MKNSGIARAKKIRKQQEAEERNEIYCSLNTKEKIALAKSRRGNSTKEIERLIGGA